MGPAKIAPDVLCHGARGWQPTHPVLHRHNPCSWWWAQLPAAIPRVSPTTAGMAQAHPDDLVGFLCSVNILGGSRVSNSLQAGAWS